MMHCYSNSCEHPLKLGQWVSDVKQLLDADVWGPTSTINPRLIDNLRELALESTTQGKTRDSKFKQMPNMPWWSQLEETVGAYFGRFFVYVVRESLYIMQTLDTEGRMEKFLAFPRGKIADTVRPYKWGFSIWEDSSYKMEYATYDNFVGEPFDDDVQPGELILCRNAMPYLSLPKQAPASEELEQIQPILDHIKASLVLARRRTTRSSWAGWPTWPSTPTGKSVGESLLVFTWFYLKPFYDACNPFEYTVPYTNLLPCCRMPIFIGDQGTGKGIILGNLLVKIFDKLAIHCPNFGSVTQKFNSDMEFRSCVFVDEG